MPFLFLPSVKECKLLSFAIGFSKSTSCDTQWPTLNSNPLVHDADSDGFLEIIYAVNYGEDAQIDRTMKVRKFSLKVDSED